MTLWPRTGSAMLGALLLVTGSGARARSPILDRVGRAEGSIASGRLCRGTAIGCLAIFAVGCAPQPPHIAILISIDTLRADHLGCYGYERPTSPTLDALAEEGVLFEDVTSSAPWTLPAHASMLTGLYPSRHGLKSYQHRLPEEVSTLASLLSERGWATAAIVNSPNLSRGHGLQRGFEEFIEFPFSVKQRSPSTLITDRVMSWIEAAGERPLFVFVHYYDVHSDYRSLPEPERRFVRPYEGPADGSTAQLFAVKRGDLSLDPRDVAHIVDLYDAGIAQMDQELGRLVAFLHERGLLDESLLVVTSDHGEEFLEHGSVLHGQTHIQEVQRIPLLLRGPGLPRGMRVATPVSLVDVAPTILSLLGARDAPASDGLDLSPLWRGETGGLDERYLLGEADHGLEGSDVTRSVRHGNFTLHLHRPTGQHRLYDLSRDPEERVDVASEREEISRGLLAHLREREEARAVEAPTRELDSEEIEQLRSLGYVF